MVNLNVCHSKPSLIILNEKRTSQSYEQYLTEKQMLYNFRFADFEILICNFRQYLYH